LGTAKPPVRKPRSVVGGNVPTNGAYDGERSPFSGTYRLSNATIVGSL
jgi:hypothetical protein